MPYDQPLKDLLRVFFAEFLQAFFPEQAAQLDLTRVTFLEQEVTTDLRGGSRRSLDLVAEVYTKSGRPELILIHIELQARPEPDFPWRFFEYYTLLRRRHRVPVLPIVLYVRGGAGSEHWETYLEEVLQEEIVRFRFRRLRLRGMKSMTVAREGNPLACALAVLMDRRGADVAELKATSLKGIGASDLDEARQWELSRFVERYLPLKGEDVVRYQALLGREEYQMAKRLDYETWREQQRLEGKREALLSVLRARFGSMPEDLTRQIQAIQASATLDSLLIRTATATSAEEIRIALTGVAD